MVSPSPSIFSHYSTDFLQRFFSGLFHAQKCHWNFSAIPNQGDVVNGSPGDSAGRGSGRLYGNMCDRGHVNDAQAAQWAGSMAARSAGRRVKP